MSTDIGSGFIFASRNLDRVHAVITEFRQQASETVDLLLAKLVARESEERADRVAVKVLENEGRSEVNYGSARGYILASLRDIETRQENVKREGRRDPQVDFSFEIGIIPTEKRLLGVYYTECKELRELWRKNPLFIEYAYHNSTDSQLDYLTERTWRRRGRAWSDAWKSGKSPAELGFVAHCTELVSVRRWWFPDTDIEWAEKLTPHWRSRGKRIRNIAKDMFFSAYAKDATHGVNNGNVNYFRVFNDFNDYLDTDEGREDLLEREMALSDLVLMDFGGAKENV